MDADDASSAEMRRPPANRHAGPLALDEDTVERLLTGALGPAQVPAGYAKVAQLLAAATAAPTPEELASQGVVLAELRAVARARWSATARRASAPRRRRRVGLAVVVVVGALATGGVAAATGHLPEPVRQAARSIITISGGGGAATPTLPEPAPVTRTAGSGSAGLGAAPSTGAPGRGPGSTASGLAAGPDLERLCRAYLSGNGGEQGEKLSATAFEALAKAAGGTDKLGTFCESLLPEDAKAKKPRDSSRQDPPSDGNQGQGGPPTSTGGGSGLNQGSPPADPNDGRSRAADR
jgi:hypothetical protein